MLVRCLYASRMAKGHSAKTIDAILVESRRNNAKNGLTGVLITAGDCFIQVLEGSRAAVCATFNSIVQDKRNSDVTMLKFEEITERKFESWAMGEINLAKVNPALLLKYSSRPVLDPFALSGTATMSLLNELVASGTVTCGNATKGRATQK
jgi:hypothetical protein